MKCLSFIIPGRHGIGTTEQTDISSAGYDQAARQYLDLHFRDKVPESQLGSDFKRVLDMYGCSSIDELKIKKGYY